MADSDLEKTEPASERRINQAREEGNVPHSRELATFLEMFIGALLLWGISGWLYQRLSGMLRDGLVFGRAEAFELAQMTHLLGKESGLALLTVLPLFAILMLVAIGGHFLVSGWVFSSKAITPDLMRLNPASGLKRMFSLNGLAELLKSLLKAVLVVGVASFVLWHEKEDVVGLMSMEIEPGIAYFARLVLMSFVWISASLGILAALDVPFQLWRYYSQLKMTKEELKQEYKEQEGDPQLKGRIRAKQREMARHRMMEAVPKADVVVTNPTHFAVALQYDGEKMGAPTVVAKGADFLAQAIRELATEHKVPILEAPPLARALYRHAEVGEQIPASLYTVVAEVMAYIYQLNHFMAQGGMPPEVPHKLNVPEGMDPGPSVSAEAEEE